MSTNTMSERPETDRQRKVPSLAIAKAKDYAPGKEYEILQAVQSLLFLSMGILNRKVSAAADQATEWLWNAAKGTVSEEKKCEMGVTPGKSGEWSLNEMDGIMESMSYVLDTMEGYQAKAHKVAQEFLKEEELTPKEASIAQKIDKTTKEKQKGSDMWDIRDFAKGITTTDFLFGSIVPNQSEDESPQDSQPSFPSPTFSPEADAFWGSFALMLGMSPSAKDEVDEGNIWLDSKLKYLNDIQMVSDACGTRIKELNSMIDLMGADSILERSEDHLGQSNVDRGTLSYIKYIHAARDTLAEYASLAESLLKDEVRCVVSEYQKCTPIDTTEDNTNGMHFDDLRKHFKSDAYNIDFRTYLAADSDNEMQTMLLNTLHRSLFIRNVGDKCQSTIRVHIGKELSVSICDAIMSGLTSNEHEHRITEWGALLFSRHARALHAYVYEFCRSSNGTSDLVLKVESSRLDAPPMDANWKRLFSALSVLKLERLADYDAGMLHPLYTTEDARKILRLRTDFSDDAIDITLLARANKDEQGRTGTRLT